MLTLSQDLNSLSYFFFSSAPNKEFECICEEAYLHMFVCMRLVVSWEWDWEFNHTLTCVCVCACVLYRSVAFFCDHCSRPFGRDINPSIKATSPQGLHHTNTPQPICVCNSRCVCFFGEYKGEPEVLVKPLQQS